MILVTGLDYSGTSATAGILQHLGVSMGRWTPTLPAKADPEQAACLSQGGHLRHWCSYEDEPLRLVLAALAAQPALAWESCTMVLSALLVVYPFPGLKTNAACLLSARPAGAEKVILTSRPERVRLERRTHYLGRMARHPRIAQIERWLQAGYTALLPQADLIVEFDELLAHPRQAVERLAAACQLEPTPRQWEQAIASIRRTG